MAPLEVTAYVNLRIAGCCPGRGGFGRGPSACAHPQFLHPLGEHPALSQRTATWLTENAARHLLTEETQTMRLRNQHPASWATGSACRPVTRRCSSGAAASKELLWTQWMRGKADNPLS